MQRGDGVIESSVDSPTERRVRGLLLRADLIIRPYSPTIG
jgi:hypothetical protein